MNEESLNENQTSRKMEYKEDVQAIQQELLERKEQIIDGAPMLLLNISKAPYYLNVLFDQDGKPKGDFRVPERYQQKVYYAFKHPNHKFSTGETYWGKLTTSNFSGSENYPIEYLIQATPTFLTEEELEELRVYHKLIKRINNVEIELIPPFYQKKDYSERVEEYKKAIEKPRSIIEEIDSAISELETFKAKLPMAPREVIINQSDNLEDSQDYPRK